MKLTIEGIDYQLDLEQAQQLGILKEIETLTINQTVYSKVEILQNKEGKIVFTLVRQYNQQNDTNPWFVYQYNKEGDNDQPIFGPEPMRHVIYYHIKSLGYEVLYPSGEAVN